MVSQQLSVVGR